MKITITGATGFIGRRLSGDLAADGHSLELAGRNPVEDLQGAEAVVHLAGAPVAQRWTPRAKLEIAESRTIGTRNLVAALARAQARPEVLISASAIGVYGDRGEETLSEASPSGGDFLAGVCVRWEAEAERAAALGIRVVKLRLGMVLGREGGALKKMLPPFRMGLGGPLGSGRQWMSWVHLDDVIGLIRFAIENRGARGALNATAPNPVRNAEFTRAMGRALKRPAIVPVPALAIRALYGEMSEILLASQRVLPQAALEAGYRFKHPELGPALESLL
jgi:uncharacterized protein (TIGR01777 family)